QNLLLLFQRCHHRQPPQQSHRLPRLLPGLQTNCNETNQSEQYNPHQNSIYHPNLCLPLPLLLPPLRSRQFRASEPTPPPPPLHRRRHPAPEPDCSPYAPILEATPAINSVRMTEDSRSLQGLSIVRIGSICG
ncbi:hypothetical protein LINPERPRIM_LOCUS31804, partial [Linum perenne]